jgi:hypothetical protein
MQYGFDLVVGRMSDGDVSGTQSFGGSPQELVSDCSRCRLQPIALPLRSWDNIALFEF